MSEHDPPVAAVRDAVARALAEDLGPLGDLTSVAVVPAGARGTGRFVARERGVLAGTVCAAEVFVQLDEAVKVTWAATDGDALSGGEELGRVEGSVSSILAGERTALNFLGHLSGVATLTRRFVEAVGAGTRVLDTRKTLPGLRALEKAAVRAGGGRNHRASLSDAVLVKDNHLRVASVDEAVARARGRWPGRGVEVECDALDQVEVALAAGVDAVLLDNMTPAEVAEAVRAVGGRVPVEVSGGVILENAADYARAGADFVSIGALTHSAPALDVGLELE